MSDDPQKEPSEQPVATENAAPAAADGDDSSVQALATRRWLAFWRRNFSSPKAAWRGFNAFTDELSRDYTFWLHFMAVRGGMSVMATSVALGLAYAATLPVALAATVVAGLVVAGGAAVIMMGAGFRYVVARGRAAYDALHHGAPSAAPKSPPPPASTRRIYRTLEKIGRTEIIRKIGASREWRIADQFVRRRKPWLLGAGAYGGATVSTGVGLWVLAGQILVLPVVAIGSAITFVTVAAATGVISGMAGFYFATKAFLRWRREEKNSRATAPAPAGPEALGSVPDSAPVAAPDAVLPPPQSAAFADAAARPKDALPPPPPKTAPSAEQKAKNPSPPPAR